MQVSFLLILFVIVITIFIIKNIPLLEGNKKKKKKKKKKGMGNIPTVKDVYESSSKEPDDTDINTANTGVNNNNVGEYVYETKIKTPSEAGIKKKGGIIKNIENQTKYMNIIFGGPQNNTITGDSLGSKYFHNTTFKCQDENSGEKVDRYVYYDNVPPKTGDSDPGLLDGMKYSASQIDPSQFESVYSQEPEPKCRKLTMETRDNDHNVSKETHYVSLYDISVLNPCSFTTEDNGPINKNPVSECECGVECNPSEFSLDLNKITGFT
tara:strand:- start:11449 stop:12249 length:801 start_codon:yes stop_codon:yes gene_type:complete